MNRGKRYAEWGRGCMSRGWRGKETEIQKREEKYA
jgi:hypothetical protein